MAKHCMEIVALCMFKASFFASYRREPSEETMRAMHRQIMKKYTWRERRRFTKCAFCTARLELMGDSFGVHEIPSLAATVDFMVDNAIIVPQYPNGTDVKSHEARNVVSAAIVYGRSDISDPPSADNHDTKGEGNITDGFEQLFDSNSRTDE